jgi:catechol 2,3-dioxygenase-like lactoylglutathione lyase family enzyme
MHFVEQSTIASPRPRCRDSQVLPTDHEGSSQLRSSATTFQKPEQLEPITPVHVSVLARNRGEVDAFYEAAVAAGGRDHGKPGPRPEYHPKYYGAFVLDPDGHNLEAVIHDHG